MAYTLLAHAPGGKFALVQHQDAPDLAYFYYFIPWAPDFSYALARNEDMVPAGWTTEYGDVPSMWPHGPQFDDIASLRTYVDAH